MIVYRCPQVLEEGLKEYGNQNDHLILGLQFVDVCGSLLEDLQELGLQLVLLLQGDTEALNLHLTFGMFLHCKNKIYI